MSLLQIFDIAGSGMTAQSMRLNVIASNLSNKDSVGKDEKSTFHAKQPIFEAVMEQTDPFSNKPALGKVRVTEIQDSKEELRKEFNPGHPFADENGFVFMPNVNPIQEMANMIDASRSYQNSVEVMQTAKNLMLKTINSMGSN